MNKKHSLSVVAAMLLAIGGVGGFPTNAALADVDDGPREPKHIPTTNRNPRIAGRKRNESCPCGCGRKAKKCPNLGVKQ
jgi:hypothetical protein